MDTMAIPHVRIDGSGAYLALVEVGGETHSLGYYPTFTDAMNAARGSVLSGEFDDTSAHPFPSHTHYGCSDDDTCDDCERAYGPHYGRCRCND